MAPSGGGVVRVGSLVVAGALLAGSGKGEDGNQLLNHAL